MNRQNVLRQGVRFSLFATSYTPLFFLIILKQLISNAAYLKFGGFSGDALVNYLRNFGFASFIMGVVAIGGLGAYFSLRTIKRSAKTNGLPVEVCDVKNKNSEAIGYIGTYIIPFLFPDYNGLYEILSMLTLLTVVYVIYVNSALILINPLLNVRYSLYEVEYLSQVAVRSLNPESRLKMNGLILTSERYLKEGDQLLFKQVGHKLFFAEHDSLQCESKFDESGVGA